MHSPFQFDADDLLQQVERFNHKLGQSHKAAATLKPECGISQRQKIWSENKLVLYRYAAATAKPGLTPLLVVYALVNRPYMLDLTAECSLLQGLLQSGRDIYLIDWGYPDQDDSDLALDDYVSGYINRCVDIILERHHLQRINLLGVCQGGTLSLCYSALNSSKVKSLITMVTPVDFHSADDRLSHCIRLVDIDLLVDTLGNVPGSLLNELFLNQKPWQLMAQKYLRMIEESNDSKLLQRFYCLEQWIYDCPDQVGTALRQFVKELYQQNRLLKDTFELAGKPVHLSQVSMPVLNIYAEQDHLVPPAASTALAQALGADDYQEIAFPGGHIGIFVSARSSASIASAINHWLQSRQ